MQLHAAFQLEGLFLLAKNLLDSLPTTNRGEMVLFSFSNPFQVSASVDPRAVLNKEALNFRVSNLGAY
jgi:hypothetical protein